MGNYRENNNVFNYVKTACPICKRNLVNRNNKVDLKLIPIDKITNDKGFIGTLKCPHCKSQIAEFVE